VTKIFIVKKIWISGLEEVLNKNIYLGSLLLDIIASRPCF